MINKDKEKIYIDFGKKNNLFTAILASFGEITLPPYISKLRKFENKDNEEMFFKVVGPVCESGDTFGEERLLGIDENSILAIHDVGAYGHVMSSNYNSRPKSSEILIEDEEVKVIRRRETYDDLLSLEKAV